MKRLMLLVFAVAVISPPAAQAVLPRPDVVAAPRDELNERIARKLYEDMLNQYKYEDAIGYVSQWVVQHSAPGGEISGVQRFRETYQDLKTAFPDYKFTVQETIADGNKVAVRYRFSGTHKGTLLGFAATGKAVSVWGVDYFRIEEGKIREVWGSPISGSLLHSIGALSQSAKAPAAPKEAAPQPKVPPT